MLHSESADITSKMPYDWQTQFPAEYLEKKGVKPLGALGALPAVDQAREVVKSYVMKHWHDIARSAVGQLRYPYLVPGATYEQLWDWDAYLSAIALPDEGLPYLEGSIRNLVENTRQDGRPPKLGLPDGTFNYDLSPIPLHAQFVYLACQRAGSFELASKLWENLLRIRHWYETQSTADNGLFVWLTYRGNGLDNNPAVYGRPAKSVSSIDLAVWHQREYQALAVIARELGEVDAQSWQQRADNMRILICKQYWDTIDELFYGIDCLTDTQQMGLLKVTWPVFLKFRNWSCLFPLWARIATQQQADVLMDKVIDPLEYLSDAGIRSHSKRDPVYNNHPTGNPSNWQGPVWVLSTALTCYGLHSYGRSNHAVKAASALIQTVAADIQTHGCMHEFYHGDTGQPVIKPGFLSWNLLAGRLLDDLDTKTDPLAIVC